MFDLEVPPGQRRKGLAIFLLGEAFERLRTRGVLFVEAQTMQHNAPALALYQKLGFKKVDEGIVYRKDAYISFRRRVFFERRNVIGQRPLRLSTQSRHPCRYRLRRPCSQIG